MFYTIYLLSQTGQSGDHGRSRPRQHPSRKCPPTHFGRRATLLPPWFQQGHTRPYIADHTPGKAMNIYVFVYPCRLKL